MCVCVCVCVCVSMPPNRPPTTCSRASPMSMTATIASAWSAKPVAIFARPPTTTAKPSTSSATTPTRYDPAFEAVFQKLIDRLEPKVDAAANLAAGPTPAQPRRVLDGVKASTPAARSLLDPACAPGSQERRSAPRNGPSVPPRNDPEEGPRAPAKIREGHDPPPVKFRDQKAPITHPFPCSGSIVIAETTRRLIGNAFELTDLGEQDLKGIAEPLHAWRVERALVTESRFDARRGHGALTPLVGRVEELDLLLRRWSQAKDGEGQVVLLSGEPGIGKSRILSTLRERLEAQGVQALRFQCSPYHVNSVFWPIIDNFERTLKFTRDETRTRNSTSLKR